MNRYYNLLLAQAGIVFLVVFLILYLIYGDAYLSVKNKVRNSIYNSLTPRAALYIILAAVSATFFVSRFSQSGITNALVFILIIGIAPYMINSSIKRKVQEDIFSEVILFCQNAGMLLKQTHNVYSSLKKASEDLKTSLASDIDAVISSLEEGNSECKHAMSVLEKRYPFSCIKNLDIILLHMFYENADVDDSLLETYQDDVAKLEQDARRNQEKRKSLRLSYILITAGSFAAYWYFTKSVSGSFQTSFNTGFYKALNAGYIFSTILAFFFVDRFFNSNITKE